MTRALPGCGGPSCKTQKDCAIGSYCVMEVQGNTISGTCRRDCNTFADCPQDPAGLT